MEITLSGDKALIAKLKKLAKDFPEAAGAALYAEGFGIWASAVKKTPVEFGVLRNSAYASPPTKDGADIGVEVGFGTKYARVQHEGLSFRHPRGGEAEFLRKAINEARAGYLQRLGARTMRNVETGVKAAPIAAPTVPKGSGSRRTGKTSSRVSKARKKMNRRPR